MHSRNAILFINTHYIVVCMVKGRGKDACTDMLNEKHALAAGSCAHTTTFIPPTHPVWCEVRPQVVLQILTELQSHYRVIGIAIAS